MTTGFDNNDYSVLIGNLLNDTRYVAVSNMGKMGGLRKHAEILVRKILNIGSDSSLMLGEVKLNSRNTAVATGLSRISFPGTTICNDFIRIVKDINQIARQGNHTQRITDFTNEEITQVEDLIFDLYAMMFVIFFMNHHVDLYFSSLILHDFSYLPPIIRFKTWNYLYSIDKYNLQVANKLCLAIIKTYGKEAAFQWLEDNEEDIRKIPYPSESEIRDYILKCGMEVEPGKYAISIKLPQFNNMYDLLLDKIQDPKTSINERGKMYSNFEEAITYFNKRIPFYETTEAYSDFSSLIQFVFLGRKSKSDLG